MSRELATTLEYDASRPIDGVMMGLLLKLKPVLGYDHLQISHPDPDRPYLTVFQLQGKRLFHVKLRSCGTKWEIQMGGREDDRVRGAIRVCKEHFDAWFGVTGAGPVSLHDRQR